MNSSISGPSGAEKYPIRSIEDGLAENDWEGWVQAHRDASATSVQLVGDDLFVTNKKFVERGVEPRGAATRCS